MQGKVRSDFQAKQIMVQPYLNQGLPTQTPQDDSSSELQSPHWTLLNVISCTTRHWLDSLVLVLVRSPVWCIVEGIAKLSLRRRWRRQTAVVVMMICSSLFSLVPEHTEW